jgi:hypothetical protein
VANLFYGSHKISPPTSTWGLLYVLHCAKMRGPPKNGFAAGNTTWPILRSRRLARVIGDPYLRTTTSNSCGLRTNCAVRMSM